MQGFLTWIAGKELGTRLIGRFLGGSERLLGGFGRFVDAPGGSGNGVRRFLGRCWAGLSKFWEDLENLSSGDVEMFKDDIWLLF